MLILSGCRQVIVGNECVPHLRELLEGFQQPLTLILSGMADVTDLQTNFLSIGI